MGCDIHLFVEKKVNGSWEALKGVNEPMIHHIQSMLQSFKDRGEDTSGFEDWIKEEQEGTYDFVDIPRNYYLYAALADVRNYDGVKPICEPRGLPSDVSAVVKEQSDGWGRGAHDRSYLTAKELSEFDWDQKIKFEGRQIQWTESLKDRVDTFYTWSIPKLIELADGDPERVRIVFWFDN
ncbi:hypothetical protein ABNF65_18300 [Paenibacillus larvae]